MERYLVIAAFVLFGTVITGIALYDYNATSASYGSCIVVGKSNIGGGKYEIEVQVETYSWDDGFRAGVLKFISPNKRYVGNVSEWRGENLHVGDRIFIRFERGGLFLIPYESKIQ